MAWGWRAMTYDLAPSGRVTVRRAVLLASLVLASGCVRAGGGVSPDPEATAEAGAYAEVLRFVSQETPSAEIGVLMSLPASGAMLFTANVKHADLREVVSRTGFRLPGRIGWMPRDDGDHDPRVFQLRPDDDALFTPAFARALHAGTGRTGAWAYPFGPAMAVDSATPHATLVFLLETDVDLHRALLTNPRVRESLPLLTAIREAGGVSPHEWATAARPALDRATREPGATRKTLVLALEVLDEGRTSVEMALRVVDHPRARRDTALLLSAATIGGEPYAAARARAVDHLLEMRHPPRRLWLELPWWERQPERINDAAVRRDTAVLRKLAHDVDPWRFPAIRAGAHRHLLAHPDTDAETVHAVAWEIATNLRRCRPYPYPARALGLAALAHPASERDARIAQALLHAPGVEPVRDAAHRRLTNQPLPPGGLPLPFGYTEDGLLRMAHNVAAAEVQRQDWRPIVAAALARMGDGPEAAEWRRIVSGVRDDDEMAALLYPGDERMTRLRRRSPFLALLPPDLRNDLGVACDLP